MGFKKRGVAVNRALFAAMGLFLGSLVVFTFIKTGVAFVQDYTSQEVYLANDIALTINTLHALSGDVIYDYTENTQNYKIRITNGIVQVSEPDKLSEGRKNYVPTAYSPIVKTFFRPKMLSLSKIGKAVDVVPYRQFFGKEACPAIATEGDIEKKIIYIDPGHYEKEKGLIGFYEEYRLTRRIAEKIKSLCLNCRVLKQKSLEEKIKSVFNPDMVISLQIGGSDELVVYSQEKTRPFAVQSEKLACLIANQFSKIIPQTRIQSENYPDEYTEKMLEMDSPAMVVQIGGINNKKMFDQEEDFRQMATAVYDAIKEYYKPSFKPLPSRTGVLIKNGAAAYS